MFWTLVDTFFSLMTFLSLQKCQNCFLRLQRNTLIKNFIWKTFPHFFRTVSISFSDSRQKFYRSLSKLFSTCSENLLKMRIFFNFLFLVHFQILSKFFSDIRHKFFRKVVKTAISMFRRTLWWKVFFRKVLQSIFGFWANHFVNLGENFTEK